MWLFFQENVVNLGYADRLRGSFKYGELCDVSFYLVGFMNTPSALPTEDARLSEMGSSFISHSETPPPDGRYGWICVGCSFVVHFFALGIESSWGVYQNHFFTSQDVGAVSNSNLAWVGSIQATGQPLVGFVAGILAQRIGFRVTGFIGTCVMCLALITASFS